MKCTEAGIKDIDRIIDLAWKIWPEWYWPVIGPEQITFMLDNIYNPAELCLQMDRGQRFFIFSIKGQDAGFLSLHHTKRAARLEKLYLLPVYRGLGNGSTMLHFAEQEALKKNHSILQLNVNRFNSSVDFYIRMGFKIMLQEDLPFGPFFLNDFVLEKTLIPLKEGSRS